MLNHSPSSALSSLMLFLQDFGLEMRVQGSSLSGKQSSKTHRSQGWIGGQRALGEELGHSG